MLKFQPSMPILSPMRRYFIRHQPRHLPEHIVPGMTRDVGFRSLPIFSAARRSYNGNKFTTPPGAGLYKLCCIFRRLHRRFFYCVMPWHQQRSGRYRMLSLRWSVITVTTMALKPVLTEEPTWRALIYWFWPYWLPFPDMRCISTSNP